MKILSLLTLATLLFQSGPLTAQNIEIQYLANEGVLIKTTNTKLLIDGAFKKEFDYLDVLPDSELEKIEKGEEGFQNIDLILATHVHGDHFNAELVGKYLTLNPETLFLGPKETVDDFSENFQQFRDIASQVKSETPGLFESKTLTLKGIDISVYRLEHFGTSPWKEAENVAYLVTIEGRKILHLGDSKIDVANLEKFDLSKENIDVAILPFWQLGSLEQKEIIEKYIRPKQILVAHIPLKAYPQAQEIMNEIGYENATALVEQFKTLVLE